MKIKLNDKSITVAADITLIELFLALKIQPKKGTALAVNEEVVSQTEWSTHRLRENDRVLYFAAIQGG